MHDNGLLESSSGILVPRDRHYDRKHLWYLALRDLDRTLTIRIGVSAYACRYGIEVYFIENFAPLGTRLAAGGPIVTVETEKAILPVAVEFPVEIVGRNEEVLADPTLITFDCYGAGWLVEVKGNSLDLLTPEDYVTFLNSLPPPQCFVKA
jgi:glycine cleavage system H protein